MAPTSALLTARDSFFDFAFAPLPPGSDPTSDFLDFVPRPRATPPAIPASPTPAAIAGVLNRFAVDATALPALFAPFTVVSLAVCTVLFLLDVLGVLRLEDVPRRVVVRD
jgi:hypothetical protein